MFPCRLPFRGLLLAGLVGLPLAAPAVPLEIELEGLSEALRANVEARLSLRIEQQRAREQGRELETEEIERLHDQASRDIRDALQPFGHYRPQIEDRLERAEGAPWRAVYRVTPGEAVRLASVERQLEGPGAEDGALRTLLEAGDPRPGQPLYHPAYEALKARVLSGALRLGYLDARWRRAELRVQPAEARADIFLTLDSGPRYRFGEVILEQSVLREDRLRAYVDLRPGEPFDPQRLLELQFTLTDLGYFQTVEIEPLRDQVDAEQRVPVRVRASPRPPRRYDTGVGYGTDTGARLSVAGEFRQLNDRGHQLRAEARLSEIKNTLGAEYGIPVGRRSIDRLRFTAASEAERLEDGDTFKYLVGSSLTRQVGRWQRRVYLEFAHEESTLGGAEITSDLFTPGLSFTRTEADDPIHARRGWYLYAELDGAQRGVLSNASFAQTRWLTRAAWPLGARARLLGRAELGASVVEDFGELPASQRFFAGGDQSVRGYAYQSLGPRDAQGQVIGGRYLATFSLEVERSLWGNWGAALFADAGGAGDRPGLPLAKALGLGLRYRSPVGSVQVDLAHPRDEGLSGVRLHLGVRVGL